VESDYGEPPGQGIDTGMIWLEDHPMAVADRIDLTDLDARARFGLPDLPDPIDYEPKSEARTERVLIIEDDPDTARFIEVNLQAIGFLSVSVERDGDSGLERIGREDFDLVLCGFMMPGLLGDEVVQRVRARVRTRNLPVVMLTAQAGITPICRAMEAGADDYITKPFDPIELLAHIRAVLRRRTR
jgi:CheY-like chemotaxis protein